MNLLELYAKISLDTSDYESGLKKASSSADSFRSKLKSGLSSAGSFASKGLGFITKAATAAGGALLALESSTEEYRIAQGKLNTSFEAAGYSAETANEAYRAFYGILGDTDTATEASQLLAKLAENEEDVASWTDIAAGVFGTFGDSLPIEGLIESSNETAKVGKVTGNLADALNWAGISEDEFNAKLEACTTESERNQLIMSTLSSTYDAASDAFYRNNEALVASRENHTKLQAAMGQIGEAVSVVKNSLITGLAPALEEIAPKIAEFIKSIDFTAVGEAIGKVINFVVDNAPTIIPIIEAIVAAFAGLKIVTTIAQGISALTTVFGLLTNPIGLVITAVASLAGGLIYLWNTNEGFREAVIAIWEAIKGVFVAAWEAIKAAWEGAGEFFSGIGESIQSAFSSLGEAIVGFFQSAWEGVQAAWNSAGEFFQGLGDKISSAFSSALDAVSGFFSKAWEGVKAVWNGAPGFFSDVGTKVQSTFSGVTDAIRGFFSKAWEGVKAAWAVAGPFFADVWAQIQSTFSAVAEVLGGFFSTAWNAVVSVWSQATAFFQGIWNSITSIFSSAAAWFGNIFSSAWNAITSAFSNVTSFFRGIFEKIVSVFNSAPGKFAEIGKNIVQGLWNGIQSLAGWLWDKVTGWVSSIWDAVTGFFQIHSPSKKFEWIGKMLVEGLGGSIDTNGGKAVKSMESWSNDLYSAMNAKPLTAQVQASGVVSASPRTVSGGGNTYVTINSPKEVDAVQAAREWRKTSQRMAMSY